MLRVTPAGYPRRVISAPPSRAFVVLLGVFVVVWTVVWILMGIWTQREVRTLRQLSTTVITSGRAVQQTGDALQGLSSIPFVGGDVGRVGRQVSAAGIDARRSGRSSRTAVDNLATLLGVSIALVPTVPMIALLVVTLRLVRGRREAGP
jgi:hypothetical protein